MTTKKARIQLILSNVDWAHEQLELDRPIGEILNDLLVRAPLMSRGDAVHVLKQAQDERDA
jgi:hypothetical protein